MKMVSGGMDLTQMKTIDRRVGLDLTQIFVIDRHVDLPSPKREGIVLTSFLCVGVLSFQMNVWFDEQTASPLMNFNKQKR